MKNYIWLILLTSFLGIGIGVFLWYRKRSSSAAVPSVEKPTTVALPSEQAGASSSTLNGEKNLKQTCISTICPFSAEAEELQKQLNAYLPKMNKILGGYQDPIIDREKSIRSRFDKLFVDGKMVLKFQTGTNQIEKLKVDGKFGKKTEQMLFIALGKNETSLNSFILTLSKDNNQQTLFSLT